MPRFVQPVLRYVWVEENGDEFFLDKDDWWDGSLEIVGSQRFIIIKEPLRNCREPDEELLACGHRQRVRTYMSGKRVRKTYNNSRLCKTCAMGVFR